MEREGKRVKKGGGGEQKIESAVRGKELPKGVVRMIKPVLF